MNEPGLTDVFVECLVADDRGAQARRAAGEQALCFELHRVQWLETLESIDSRRVLCHFRAPDAEAVRQVLRRIDIPISALWVAPGKRTPAANLPSVD